MATKKSVTEAIDAVEAQSKGVRPLRFVGVDDGHYSVKVVTESGDMFSMPSRAKVGRSLISLSNSDDDYQFLVAMPEGTSYTVHESLQTYDDTRYMDYPRSAHSRVLVHKALLRAGLAGEDVSIVTGLPVDYFFLPSGEENEILIQAKIENLTKEVVCGDRPMVNIVSNSVSPEALAAYVDQMMDMQGRPTKFYETINDSMVGVIDIGGKTTDCAVVLPRGKIVDKDRSGSNDIGVLMLNQTIASNIQSTYQVDNVPPRMVEMALRTGNIKVAGDVIDVSKMVDVEKERFAEKVIVGVKSKIGAGKDLDTVLFVGGGSIVMKDQLTKFFKHSQIPVDPEFANARGMFKIAKYFNGGEA